MTLKEFVNRRLPAAGPFGAGRRNRPFPLLLHHSGMTSRTIAQLEADIVALRASAERAGTALACLFSSSDEFEAEVVRLRREQGAFGMPARKRNPLLATALVCGLALVFWLI